MHKAALALTIGGIISLAIGLAISVVIGYVIRDDSFEYTAGTEFLHCKQLGGRYFRGWIPSDYHGNSTGLGVPS